MVAIVLMILLEYGEGLFTGARVVAALGSLDGFADLDGYMNRLLAFSSIL